MPPSPLEVRLAARTETDPVVRIVKSVLDWLPGDVTLAEWTDFEGGVAALGQGNAASARQSAEAEAAVRALSVFDGLDEGDDVFSIASGLGTALRLAMASGKGAAPGGLAAMLVRQRADAADKLLAVAVALGCCFPGNPEEALARTRRLPSGEVLLTWLAGVELFCPFVGEAVARAPSAWLESELPAAAARVRGSVTESELAAGKAIYPILVAELLPRVERLARTPLDVAKLGFKWLPRVAGVVDGAGAVAAGAVDLVPVYQLLGERFVAEVAIDGFGVAPPLAIHPPRTENTDDRDSAAPVPPAAVAPAVAAPAVEMAAVEATDEVFVVPAELRTGGGEPQVEVAPPLPREEPPPPPAPPRVAAPPPRAEPPPPRAAAPPLPREEAPPRAAPAFASRPLPRELAAPAAVPEAGGGRRMLGLGVGALVGVVLCGGGAVAAVGAWWLMVGSARQTEVASPAPAPVAAPIAAPVAEPAPFFMPPPVVVPPPAAVPAAATAKPSSTTKESPPSTQRKPHLKKKKKKKKE